MGKITSIYLTEREAKQLEKFCEENQCTQYSALKTALRELLLKPAQEDEAPAAEEKEEINVKITAVSVEETRGEIASAL